MGIRVLKTAIAAIIAIYLSQAAGLASPLSAGLLAIMGVEVTIKRGLRTSFQRIAASAIGLFAATGLFWLFGFHVWVIGIYVLLIYPLLARLELKEGIITSSVIMLHVFATGELGLSLLLNEMALLAVGLGTAAVINMLYMPEESAKLLHCRLKVEELYSRIFREIAEHLRHSEYVWNGAELLQAEDAVLEGVKLAERTEENHLLSGEPAWTLYFYMREQQLRSIGRMVRLVASVYQSLPHGELLASVFDELQQDVKKEHYTGRSEQKLSALQSQFRGMPLPQSREEFEVRAALLQLVEELKAYLAIARRDKRPLTPAAGEA